MSSYYDVNASSMLKLQSLAYMIDEKNGHANLKKLCSKYLNVKYERSWLIESKGWDSLKLSKSHIFYSANEVRACIELFKYFALNLKMLRTPNEHVDLSKLQDIIKLDQENYREIQAIEKPKVRRIYEDLRNVDQPDIFDKLNMYVIFQNIYQTYNL